MMLNIQEYRSLRKFVTRSGGERAILGYVCKNGPVREDINPSIYIINLTPLVNKNLTFYCSGPSCSKLTMSLVYVSLNFQM